MNWQPIETAPKDGTWVLLCFKYWGEPPHSLTPIIMMGAVEQHAEGVLIERNWWAGPAVFVPSNWPQPTHWMPLPQPPSE